MQQWALTEAPAAGLYNASDWHAAVGDNADDDLFREMFFAWLLAPPANPNQATNYDTYKPTVYGEIIDDNGNHVERLADGEVEYRFSYITVKV